MSFKRLSFLEHSKIHNQQQQEYTDGTSGLTDTGQCTTNASDTMDLNSS